MTTSGTASFNPAVTFMVTSALRRIGAISEDEQPSGGQWRDSLFAMNAMVKEWQATGIHVWTEEEAIMWLQTLQERYTFGGTNTTEACDAHAYVFQELGVNAVAGALTITLEEPAVGFLDTNRIGIQLDSGVIQWTTINGAPAGNIVTITDALLGNCSQGNFAWSYSPGEKIGRPLKIPRCRRLQWNGLTITPLGDMLSRQEYMDLPNPLQPGTPNQAFYDPRRETGDLYVWQPVNDAAVFAMRFTWMRSIQDFLLPNNTADFPQEWIDPLTWNLAARIGPDYNWPQQVRDEIKDQAMRSYDVVQGWDRESEDILFGIDWQRR